MWLVRVVTMLMAMLCGLPVSAHEYWVEPVEFHVEAGAPLQAYLKVGMDFEGSTYPFIPARFQAFTLTVTGETADYVGRVGDNPAVQIETAREGLNIIGYHSTPDRLVFGREGLLEKYLKLEGLERVLEAHRADGLAETGFSERYTRNAKALVQVGAAGGVDKALGLPFELVAVGTPYDGDEAVRVQLLWRGKPQGDWPINVFTDTGRAVKTRVHTDADGFAEVAFPAGSKVLLNSVYIQRNGAEAEDLYESWWASLTFGQ